MKSSFGTFLINPPKLTDSASPPNTIKSRVFPVFHTDKDSMYQMSHKVTLSETVTAHVQHLHPSDSIMVYFFFFMHNTNAMCSPYVVDIPTQASNLLIMINNTYMCLEMLVQCT